MKGYQWRNMQFAMGMTIVQLGGLIVVIVSTLSTTPVVSIVAGIALLGYQAYLNKYHFWDRLARERIFSKYEEMYHPLWFYAFPARAMDKDAYHPATPTTPEVVENPEMVRLKEDITKSIGEFASAMGAQEVRITSSGIKKTEDGIVSFTFRFHNKTALEANKVIDASDKLQNLLFNKGTKISKLKISVRQVERKTEKRPDPEHKGQMKDVEVGGYAVFDVIFRNFESRADLSKTYIFPLETLKLKPGQSVFGMSEDGDMPIIEREKTRNKLIAGTNGSGKSNQIRSDIVCSMLVNMQAGKILERNTICDPKGGGDFTWIDPSEKGALDFAYYESVGFRFAVDEKSIINVLKEARAEMLVRNKWRAENRYDNIFVAFEQGDYTYPIHNIIIDEFAELMLDKKLRPEVETAIKSIAQMGRASGVFLTSGTQYPLSEVVSGIVKMNHPTVIGFPVGTKQQSQVIMDDYDALTGLKVGECRVKSPEYWSEMKGFKSFFITSEQRTKLALDYKKMFGKKHEAKKVELEAKQEIIEKAKNGDSSGIAEDLYKEILKGKFNRDTPLLKEVLGSRDKGRAFHARLKNLGYIFSTQKSGEEVRWEIANGLNSEIIKELINSKEN